MPIAPAPLVSVVIPHLNQPEMLRACLSSLAAQQDAPPAEILVVDNGSSNRPESLCAEFGAKLLIEPAPGPGPARSCGAGTARGEILAFIDADCRADSDWLAAISARFADPATQIVGGAVRIAFAVPGRPSAIEAYESLYGYRMALYIARDGYAATCNMAVRRLIFAAVGPFAGLSFAEDMDWGRRAGALGYRHTYAPEMRISTPARARFADLARKWDRHIAHDFAVLQPGGRARLGWITRAASLALSPIVELPRILRSDRAPGMRARCLAFSTMVRIRLYRVRTMMALLLGADGSALSGSWNRD